MATDFVKRREPTTFRSKKMLDKALPLFPKGKLRFNKVNQQLLRGCPLPAVIAAITRVCEKQIRGMVQIQPGTFSRNSVKVTSWFDGEKERKRFTANKLIRVKFFGWSVRLSPFLYFDGLGHPRFAFSDDKAGWASYIEKAYVMLRGNHVYENLDAVDSKKPSRSRKPQAPLSVQRIMIDLVGPIDQADMTTFGKEELVLDIDDPSVGGFSQKLTKSRLKKILKQSNRYATIATTPSTSADASKHGIVTFHTYTVVSSNGKTVKLYNALPTIGKREPKISFNDFWKIFDGVFQARRHWACKRNRGRVKG